MEIIFCGWSGLVLFLGIFVMWRKWKLFWMYICRSFWIWRRMVLLWMMCCEFKIWWMCCWCSYWRVVMVVWMMMLLRLFCRICCWWGLIIFLLWWSGWFWSFCVIWVLCVSCRLSLMLLLVWIVLLVRVMFWICCICRWWWRRCFGCIWWCCWIFCINLWSWFLCGVMSCLWVCSCCLIFMLFIVILECGSVFWSLIWSGLCGIWRLMCEVIIMGWFCLDLGGGSVWVCIWVFCLCILVWCGWCRGLRWCCLVEWMV